MGHTFTVEEGHDNRNMKREKEYKSGKDIIVMVLLIVSMVLRLCTEKPGILVIFSFISFVVAAWDIYSEVEDTYGYYKQRFLIVRGTFILGAGLCAVIVMVVFFCNVSISKLAADELSILALLVSLPKDMYCYVLGKYIQGKGDDKR